MIDKRHPRVLALALACGTATVCSGCGQPSLVFSDGPVLAFWDTALTQSAQRRVTVDNAGDSEVTIDHVSVGGLAGAGPFRLLTVGGGGECGPGLVLAPGTGRCSLTIEFHPLDEGMARDRLILGYRKSEGKARETVGLDLSGTGILDCGVHPDLTAGRLRGVDDATGKNRTEVERARTAAAALTLEDGQRDGYAAGYADGYDTAYHGANGYPAGYSEGYAEGYLRGTNDPASCDQGLLDATVDGHAEGHLDGSRAGYAAGYAEGEPDGDAQGYSDGWEAAKTDCTGGAFRPESDPPSGEDLARHVEACYRQGYRATLDPETYQRTFDAEKWLNPDYKRGFDSTWATGRTDGTARGEAEGRTTGYDDGAANGFLQGATDLHTRCYEQQFGIAYDEGYSLGWGDQNAGYPQGYADGYDAAYTSAWRPGYDEGYKYFCGS